MLREKLQQMIEAKHLLKHPFYQAWTEGKLSREQLKNYAVQYFQNVLAFPTYLSAVHFNTPAFDNNIAVRQEILENLIEEERGADNHPALWRRFALSLEATDDELANAEMLSTTRNLINTFRELCLNSPFYAGLAAMYAYESQIPAVSRVKIDGLKEFYGVTDPGEYEFFTVHEAADVWHSESELQIIEKYADTPERETEVLAVAEKAATALWQFLDGVYDNYCADVKYKMAAA